MFGCTECGLVCSEGDIQTFDTHGPYRIPDLHYCLGCSEKKLKAGYEPPEDQRHRFNP
jgi:hypothetical protein